jgi:hypothetical protein
MATHLRTAIKKVLSSSLEPQDIDQIAVQLSMEGDLRRHGVVPLRTIYSHLENAVKDEGDCCPFIRTSTGCYMLKAKASSRHILAARKSCATEKPNEGGQRARGIFTCYGLAWQRNRVVWTPNPEILGCQFQATIPVNFCQQIGFYALQKQNGDVEYVGHTVEQPIGACLYYHTLYRLSYRWERFSFFGLRPVSDRGTFGRLPADFKAADIMASMGVIMVELARPLVNKKAFNLVSTLEFSQWEIPAFK